MKLSTIILMIAIGLAGLVGLFLAAHAAYGGLIYWITLGAVPAAWLAELWIIKLHFDEESALSEEIGAMKKFVAGGAAIVWALLIYQYVLAQWPSIVKPQWNIWFPVSLVILVFVAAVLSCLEASLANLHLSDLNDWFVEKTKPLLSDPVLAADPEALKSRTAPYLALFEHHKSFISDKRRKEDHATFLLVLVTVTEVCLTVLYILSLNEINGFPSGSPALFAMWWPFGGTSGFVSVGIALVLLILVGILPNKIAIRRTVECFMSLSWILRPHIGPLVVQLFVAPVDIGLDLVKIREKG